MRVAAKKTIHEGRFLRIVEKAICGRDGTVSTWETIERTNIHGSGAVVIIALTCDRHLLFEKNWRAGTESYVVQFPAGLTDLAGENEEDAARRELLEETGYAAASLIPVFLSPLSAAITSTRAMHYFAPQATYLNAPASNASEGIEVIKVPVDEADRFMLNLPEGVELDLQVPGILWLLRQRGLI